MQTSKYHLVCSVEGASACCSCAVDGNIGCGSVAGRVSRCVRAMCGLSVEAACVTEGTLVWGVRGSERGS
jgi:hypothetical protein